MITLDNREVGGRTPITVAAIADDAIYMERPAERVRDRVRPTSPQRVAAQVVAIRRWGAQEPMDLSSIEHRVLEQFVPHVLEFLGDGEG